MQHLTEIDRRRKCEGCILGHFQTPQHFFRKIDSILKTQFISNLGL
jgi:hypothetical protein